MALSVFPKASFNPPIFRLFSWSICHITCPLKLVLVFPVPFKTPSFVGISAAPKAIPPFSCEIFQVYKVWYVYIYGLTEFSQECCVKQGRMCERSFWNSLSDKFWLICHGMVCSKAYIQITLYKLCSTYLEI